MRPQWRLQVTNCIFHMSERRYMHIFACPEMAALADSVYDGQVAHVDERNLFRASL